MADVKEANYFKCGYAAHINLSSYGQLLLSINIYTRSNIFEEAIKVVFDLSPKLFTVFDFLSTFLGKIITLPALLN